ncbi:hypothetical protein ONS95_003436 [Cadophora gregata]|uniref:uncharacterized protein n=1 Tax=Cadophora gregata TaxID=51156 RepID=UPI0026DB8B57|nr:uncharacterized protein ONS95_003436 [Cadophora gregata]KAK0108643.1 hypothetical protein ONS95_003436 [Cadophora gregata]
MPLSISQPLQKSNLIYQAPRVLLRPIQGTIRVREQHYKNCLKEKDTQILALKLELSKAKLSAKATDEYLLEVRGELQDAKRDMRRLRSEVEQDEKKILELETKNLGSAKGNGRKIQEYNDSMVVLQHELATLGDTVDEQTAKLFDLHMEDIAQRGEIHLLKKDIEALQKTLEVNRAAADWLVQNGPSLQEDFRRMADEIGELKYKGADMARLMTKSARKWERRIRRGT